MDFILDCSEYISGNVSDTFYNIISKLKYITSTSVFDMHLINEIDCYFSNLKVIFDIDFFGAGLLFIFICISTSFLFNIRLFR